MEAVRRKAALLMSMGDVVKSVVPKFGLLAQAKAGGTAATRYFMPWKCHPTLAATGSQCLSACLLAKGTVGDGLVDSPPGSPVRLSLEHPMGQIDIVVDYSSDGDDFAVNSAGLVRTARMLARGEVFVPASVWKGA